MWWPARAPGPVHPPVQPRKHVSNPLRSVLPLFAALAIALGTVVAVQEPAHAAAATQCKTSTRSFDLPRKPDVKVKATICIKRTGTSGGYRYYRAWVSKVSWDGTGSFTGGKRFNEFSISMRAESGKTTKTACSKNICESFNLASAINGKEKGTKTFSSSAGTYGIVLVKTKKKNWTGDATAFVDIADDGKSGSKWGLTGTKRVA